MLLDVFSTAYSFNKDVIQPDLFEQVRILEFPFLIGFYMNSERSPYALKACVAEGSEQQFNFDIYPTVLKHIQGPTVRVSKMFHCILLIGREGSVCKP